MRAREAVARGPGPAEVGWVVLELEGDENPYWVYHDKLYREQATWSGPLIEPSGIAVSAFPDAEADYGNIYFFFRHV